MYKVDMKGKRYGRYVVIRYMGENKRHESLWECKCDCGNIKVIPGIRLRKGGALSCGCLHKDEMIKRQTTHGLSHTRIHDIWKELKQRCTNKSNSKYKYYGEKGITVCDEWSNSFINFYNWSIENGYNDTLTIDRIDSSKGYDPSNCRWVSYKVQNNNKSDNKRYIIDGVNKTLSEWCQDYQVPFKRINNRISKGWDIYKALTTPPLKKNGKPL